MSDTLNDLKDFSKPTGNKFFSFEKEKELEAFFKSASKEQDRFGKPGEMAIAYRFLDQAGEDREFSSKSKRLAKALVDAGVHTGDLVRISRSGVGYDTVYSVKILDKQPRAEEQPQVEQIPEPPTQEDALSDIEF